MILFLRSFTHFKAKNFDYPQTNTSILAAIAI